MQTCGCGFEGRDLLVHWASVPTCMPAYIRDREAEIGAAPRPPPPQDHRPTPTSDAEGARALIHSQTVRRLGKLVLKDKVRLKTTQEFKALMNEHNEFAAHAQALESDHLDPTTMQARYDLCMGSSCTDARLRTLYRS